MDKTEKRTAEDMYSNVVGRPGIHKDLPLHINATGEYLRKDIVLTAMHEYAAQELANYKAVIEELIPIAERHVYLHGNDDSVVNRKSIIERAHKLIDKL